MRLTPSVKISFSLVLITISILLSGTFAGVMPDKNRIVMESRQKLCESLAVQFSLAAQNGSVAGMRPVMALLVQRNDDVTSIALRAQNQSLLVFSGDHTAFWKEKSGAPSTLKNVQVPIFKGNKPWATMEVSFTPLSQTGILAWLRNSFWGLIVFVAVFGFPLYYFFMKKTLRALDPSAVIPARVKAAFDVFEEGVLLMDEKEQIIMTNVSFADKIGKSPEDLIGFQGSELPWIGFDSPEEREELPWVQVLSDNRSRIGISLSLKNHSGEILKFVINASPILDGKGEQRGVLVTCDDVTELEEKNLMLHGMVNDLQKTQEEIQDKNVKLEFLASHDPMTKLLNRRAFNSRFDEMFRRSVEDGTELSCIMTDIDHFKRVNDNHGHAVGDKVIIAVAKILQVHARKSDIVGRYGGEEFCIVFPGMMVEKAAEVAEQIRLAIKKDLSAGVPVTNSLGVSSLLCEAESAQELLDQADKALYIAKESGRNRVVIWDGSSEEHGVVPEAVEKEVETVQDVAPDIVQIADPVVSTTGDDIELHRLSVRVKELEGITEQRGAELEHNATHDAVTGLPNRILFDDRISQSLARGYRFDSIVAMLSISIETISTINDVLGHSIADELLKLCGERLGKTLRTVDTVASLQQDDSPDTEISISRLGQEEFGVLLTDVEHVDAITWIVKRILDSFTERFEVQENEIYVTMNIGISLFPYDGEEPQELQQSAAAARRYAKTTLGQNSYHFYFEDVNTGSIKQLQIEGQLRSAINNDEFVLYYQPIVETGTCDIVEMEALIRWQNPRSGLVFPNDFISIAEYSGLIVPMGEWVLSTACRQIKAWREAGLGDVVVAVNLSPKQIHAEGIIDTIQAVIDRNGIPPGLLKIEVTESCMMQDINKSIDILGKINGLGVDIAIDDFGTGYSSLNYLKRFPAQFIKIDRCFIADIETSPKDVVLVTSFIKMAHAMDLKVVAEGVETRKQFDMLAEFDCDLIQGYLLSKPVPDRDASGLLKEGFGEVLSS